MKTILNTQQGKFTIISTFKGDKRATWDDRNENYNNHLITVSHDGKRLSFDFWASIMNPEIRKDSENIEAFDSFVRDAVASKDSFENFCSEFGYDTDSRSAERIYKACLASLHKLERIYDGDVYALANELSEKVN